MGKKRSGLKCDLKIYIQLLMAIMLICLTGVSFGVTNPSDVAAINNMYVALGSPVLPGWIATGGDPCGEKWQGVECIDTNIVRIVLNGANLGGELGDSLGMFTSIKVIDFSNNHIGGYIPSNLPVTMQNFFLSANQFTGSIPESLSSLCLLTDMSLNNNLLTGEIPDSFQSLTGLINLDLSSNNLCGLLPPSLENLSSLTTLLLQNNQLSGTLDVLQDLPLRVLNIENNLFNGPIPEKLLHIPDFRKDGNPLCCTIAPPPPSTSPLIPPPSPSLLPDPETETPSSRRKPRADGRRKKFLRTQRLVWISVGGVSSFTILVVARVLFVQIRDRRRRERKNRPSVDIGPITVQIRDCNPPPVPIKDSDPPPDPIRHCNPPCDCNPPPVPIRDCHLYCVYEEIPHTATCCVQ